LKESNILHIDQVCVQRTAPVDINLEDDPVDCKRADNNKRPRGSTSLLLASSMIALSSVVIISFLISFSGS